MQEKLAKTHFNTKKLTVIIILLSATTLASLAATLIVLFVKRDEVEVKEVEKTVYVEITPTTIPIEATVINYNDTEKNSTNTITFNGEVKLSAVRDNPLKISGNMPFDAIFNNEQANSTEIKISNQNMSFSITEFYTSDISHYENYEFIDLDDTGKLIRIQTENETIVNNNRYKYVLKTDVFSADGICDLHGVYGNPEPPCGVDGYIKNEGDQTAYILFIYCDANNNDGLSQCDAIANSLVIKE
jgi:regulatory protein YycI of two-component signal transduction system YycFG